MQQRGSGRRRQVKAKKRLGQHFLIDAEARFRIVEAVEAPADARIVEIGPGMGSITEGLAERFAGRLTALELDEQSVEYLQGCAYSDEIEVLHANCLHFDYDHFKERELVLVGNLPYNISSQILIKLLELRERVSGAVFMLQREVAQRVASDPGGREYGTLSVQLQAFYDVELLFTLPPSSFDPPPKVHSSVVRLRRNEVVALDCDEGLFRRVVRGAFNQRRKTLRNSLKSAFPNLDVSLLPFAHLRPEALSVPQFMELTNAIDRQQAEWEDG